MTAWNEQFSCGDQSDESRLKFINGVFKKCIQCSEIVIEERDVAGCRMNRDAYGTTVFKCNKCKWYTSFQRDDSSDNYYYEVTAITQN